MIKRFSAATAQIRQAHVACTFVTCMNAAVVWTSAGELVGLVLASYGLIRESFANLAEGRPFGEGRFGEGTYGGGVSRFTQLVLNVATALRLLPPDRNLTLTDRKRNAALAITGVLIGALSLLFELILSLRGS